MRKKAKIIAIACHKGGVGKTTTSASIGGIFSEREKVLLVDLDPQMNLTSTFTDGEFQRTVFDAFKEYKLKRQGTLPVYRIRENLDIVPSCLDMCTIDSDFASVPGRDIILKKLLAPLVPQYDWIIIDLPAQLGAITVNALTAADKVLIPMSCDAYSADGLQQMANFVSLVQDINEKLDLLGVLITRFNPRRTVDNIVSELLNKEWNGSVFETRIRENAAISKAPLMKKDILSYDPKSKGAQDYISLCDEIRRVFG